MNIDETMEALDAVMMIVVLMIVRMKDGIGMDDAMAVWEKMKDDVEFKMAMEKGFDGIKKVPAEVADLNMIEMSRIAMKMLGYMPEIVAAMKK